MTVYVLTKSVNDYNQHGEYFIAWFKEVSVEILMKALYRKPTEDWVLEQRQSAIETLIRTGECESPDHLHLRQVTEGSIVELDYY